jgi:hypothetical protein
MKLIPRQPIHSHALALVVSSIPAAAALVSAGAQAPKTGSSAPGAGCASFIQGYDSAPNPAQSWELQIPRSNGGGALWYIGAIHSRDPNDPQFATLDSLWRIARPTVAFYEGPDRGIRADRATAINETGESGYLRYLAHRDGARIKRLEPNPQDEVDYLLAKFPADQVKLFYVLRQAQQIRDREHLEEAAIRQSIGTLLERAKVLRGIGNVISTLPELDSAYRQYWGTTPEWWRAPERWFDPVRESSKTGGIFTNEINRRSSEFRDLHMYRVLSQAAEKERVFAIVGRNHVAAQADALRCQLAPK